MYLQSDHLLTRRWQQGLTPGRPCTSVLILPQYGSVQVTLIGQQSTFQGRSDKVLERQAVGAQLLLDALSRFNISAPVPFPATRSGTIPVRYQLDRNKQVAYSEFLRRSGMRLGDFIRLLRGERAADTSPNKALWVPTEVPSWRSYRFAPQWEDIVQHGVVPEWREVPPAQSTPPPNHGSARRALNMVVKNIRKGQDEDRYLILDIDLIDHLDGIFCSPFGAVPKGDKPLSEDARVIHDLSFPLGSSLNEATLSRDDIDIRYDGARAIASRIEDVEREFPGLAHLMSGDVNGAFRHIPLHADHCGKFAGTIPELGVLVVDLCCPFGWRNSPASYAIAGGAINHLYSSTRPLWPGQPARGAAVFDGKVWCDDHNCVEPDVGTAR